MLTIPNLEWYDTWHVCLQGQGHALVMNAPSPRLCLAIYLCKFIKSRALHIMQYDQFLRKKTTKGKHHKLAWYSSKHLWHVRISLRFHTSWSAVIMWILGSQERLIDMSLHLKHMTLSKFYNDWLLYFWQLEKNSYFLLLFIFQWN